MRDRDTGQRGTEPTLLDDTAKLRREAFRKLVEASRSLPQMGIYDPAGIAEKSIVLARDSETAREYIPAQTPEAAQSETVQPKRGIIRRILGR